jgi:uncharacterized membrane protein YkoI
MTITVVFIANASDQKIDMIDLIEKLNAKGYHNLHEIDLDDDEFEVEGFNQDGRQYKLHLNAKKLEIPNIKANKKHLTMLEIAKKARAAGYHDFVKIKFSEGYYKIAAHNAKNTKVKLIIDPKTGIIKEKSKDWFENLESKF